MRSDVYQLLEGGSKKAFETIHHILKWDHVSAQQLSWTTLSGFAATALLGLVWQLAYGG